MNKNLRKSVPARLAAIGFILVIISGNFWLVNMFFNEQPHLILVYGMQIGMILVFVGAVGLALLGISGKFKEAEIEDEADDE